MTLFTSRFTPAVMKASYGHGRGISQFSHTRSWLAGLLAAILLVPFAARAVAANAPIQMVVLGDSLSAGYLLPQDAAFPAVLEKALRAEGLNVEVANAGVSGDTSRGGLERLDWAVPDGVQAVLVELGANDMLRGLDPARTQEALGQIIARLKARNIRVMLAGMMASPSLGRDYGDRFNAIYPALAEKYGVPLYPFFLQGVAGDRSLNLEDGLHPNRKGVELMVQSILPAVKAFLGGVGG